MVGFIVLPVIMGNSQHEKCLFLARKKRHMYRQKAILFISSTILKARKNSEAERETRTSRKRKVYTQTHININYGSRLFLLTFRLNFVIVLFFSQKLNSSCCDNDKNVGSPEGVWNYACRLFASPHHNFHIKIYRPKFRRI